MKNLWKICGAWLLVFALLLGAAPVGFAADDDYAVSVSATSAEEIMAGDTVEISASVQHGGEEISNLSAAGLKLWFWADIWEEHTDGLDSITVGNNSGDVLTNDITFHETGTYYIIAELKSGDTSLAKGLATITTTETEPPISGEKPDLVESSIYVPYVAGTDGDFIRGADVSSLLSILNSGARFQDWNGYSLGSTVDAQGEGFMELLADAGVNWVRLRVWNDPFDMDGNGYGGGNNDLDAAVTMGQWASDAGLKVLIDFHYSDFWADPAKQKAPKAWENLTVDEKAEAVRAFTKDSLTTMLEAGVDVGMVQIGNETNNGICGVMYDYDGWEDASKIFSAGCDAVHEAGERFDGRKILAAVHFANPEKAGAYNGFAQKLEDYHVDYECLLLGTL